MARKREMQWLSDTYTESRVSNAEREKRNELRMAIAALSGPLFEGLDRSEISEIRERVRGGLLRQSVWPGRLSGYKRGKN